MEKPQEEGILNPSSPVNKGLASSAEIGIEGILGNAQPILVASASRASSTVSLVACVVAALGAALEADHAASGGALVVLH